MLSSIPEATFKTLMSKYQLEREMLLELISGIDVGKITKENKQTSQEIRIHYNLHDKVQ